MITLENLRVVDIYNLIDELDKELRKVDFNSRSFSYRTGVRRMRNYLDHVASGLRMIKGGEYEPHTISSIHNRRRL